MTFLVEGFQRSNVAISRRQIVQQVLSALFAWLGENVWVWAKPANEARCCQFGKCRRVKVEHRAVGMILNLSENSMTRFLPVLINIIEWFIESFHCYKFNFKAPKDDRCFHDARQVHLEEHMESSDVLNAVECSILTCRKALVHVENGRKTLIVMFGDEFTKEETMRSTIEMIWAGFVIPVGRRLFVELG